MKKNVFTTSYRILLPVILAIALLAPKIPGQIVILILFGLWILFLLAYYIFSGKKPSMKRLQPVHRRKICQNNESIQVLSPNREKGMALSPEDVQVLMTQYRLRISEKLKSAYPEAVWKWVKEPDLRNLMDCDTVRIQVENMAEFTHADVYFDFYGRIHINPMTIGNFNPENDSDCDTPVPTEPAVIDVKAWFDLVGRQILDKQITELNAQGHSKLTIKENGDIVINCQSSPNLCVHSSSSYVSPSMLPLSSGDLIEWSLVCHSTLSYQKFCARHSNHYDHPEELHQSVE